MLAHLSIQRYLLIRELSLELPRGLIVLTGETGAGKSMILSAISVLLGAPFPKDDRRSPDEKTVIEGVFRGDSIDAVKKIAGLEYFEDDDDELLLRRELSAKGRARSFLNDQPIPQARLLEICDVLLDSHGQRDSQVLFRADRQLAFLDEFAGTLADATALRQIHRKRQELSRQLNTVSERLDSHTKEQALLTYQLEEIERLGLQAGEEEQIELQLKKLENSERLGLSAGSLSELLSEGDGSLLDLLGKARLFAGDLARYDDETTSFESELKAIDAQIKDLAGQIRDYADSIDMNESELESLRERRGVLWDLKRKHGMGLDEIIARAGELKELLATGESLREEVEQLQSELQRSGSDLVRSATKLSKSRQSAAGKLSKEIEALLKPLGFAKAAFQVQVESTANAGPEEVRASGLDSVSFQFTANPGTEPRALSDVASGGEASRVLLAIKSVLAEQAAYPLMIFDEIDLGISGQIAERVGEALAKLGDRHQLIVISHLPQIASAAEHHLLVEKQIRGRQASSGARFLSQEERVPAIAALMAGKSVTKQSLASADELLSQRKTTKKIKPIG